MLHLKKILEKWGIHSLLLPVFFVLHNYIQYYGLVSGRIGWQLLGETELVFVAVILLLLLLTRNINRSLQVTTLLGFVALFFGIIKDFFKDTLHLGFMARYIVLLPLLAVASIVLIVVILKKRNFSRSNLFQNLLLIIFILVDGSILLCSDTSLFRQKNLLVTQDMIHPDTLSISPTRPDVYYLVFDSYPGTGFLRDYVQYDNSPFNTALENIGFHVVPHPQSNYNRTVFSMAATLNFEYLRGITENMVLEPKHYNQAKRSVEQAEAPLVFAKEGYRLYNLSVFDINNHPPLYRENFLAYPETKILLYNTLAECIRRDILWNFRTGKFGIAVSEQAMQAAEDEQVQVNNSKRDFNNTVIDSLFKISARPTASPKFIYAHLYLPHPPFFYDSSGRPRNRNPEQIKSDLHDKTAFIGYLHYTNKIILQLVGDILRQQRTPPIIVLQSDHGYRDFRQSDVNPHLYFNNYSAFYFPNRQYAGLRDSLSNINTFPVIFNTFFNTHIPLQKDASVFTDYPD